MNSTTEIIEKLNLTKHPEGGYYSETYRSSSGYSEINESTPRAFSSCIYYLLESGDKSMFHRIKQDEMWHFYAGSNLEIHTISADGEYTKSIIGNSEGIFNFQKMILANTWMAATPIDADSFTLIGCTVAPAFEFRDFELAVRESLLGEFPNLTDVINQFTKLY